MIGKSASRFLATLMVAVFAAASPVYPQQAATVAEPLPPQGQDMSIKPAGTGVIGEERVAVGALNPYSISVPAEWGRIEEVFQGAPDAPVIVHIQDAHANYEAQLNIKNILKHLATSYRIQLIQLEGASSKLNPAIFETSYLKESNLKVADYLMREGRLSGAEAFALETEDPVELFGVEDRTLYLENLRTFRSVYSHQKEVEGYFQAMRVLAKDLRTKLLNEELLDLARNMEAYSKESIELLDYLLYLNTLAEKHKVASLASLTEISRFPNLVRILRLHELEKTMNERDLNREAEALGKELLAKRDTPEVREIAEKLALKQKSVKPRVYYRKVTALAEELGIDLLTFPALRTLAEFLILQDEIEHHGLFDEVTKLEKLLQENLLKSEDEKRLLDLLKYMDLLEQYFKLEVNREKLVFILKRYEEMKTSVIHEALDGMATQHSILPSDFKGDTAALDGFMEEVEYFYRVVLERDRLFVQNVTSRMKDAQADRTVLITGGFHTDGLTTLLRKENISYIVVLPKVNVKEGNETYVKVMLDDGTAIGSVFAGTFALRQALLAGDLYTPDVLQYILAYGSNLTALDTARAEVERGVPDADVTLRLKEHAQGFNAVQRIVQVTPLRTTSTAEETVFEQEVDYIDRDGVLRSTVLTGTLYADNSFKIVASTPKPLRNTELAAGLERPADVFEGLSAERVSQAPRLTFEALEELAAAAAVQPSAEEAPARAEVYPGVLDLRTTSQFPRLAQLDGNPTAIRNVGLQIDQAIQSGTPLTLELIGRLIANATAGSASNINVTDELIDQAVEAGRIAPGDAARLKAFLGVVGQAQAQEANPQVVLMPVSNEPEVADSQIQGIVSRLFNHEDLIISAFAENIEALTRARAALPQEVAKRLVIVEVEAGQELLQIEKALKRQTPLNLMKTLLAEEAQAPTSIVEYRSGEYVRVALPEDLDDKKVQDFAAQYPYVLQLASIAESSDILTDDVLLNAVAWIEPHAATLLRKNAEALQQQLQDLDLVDMLVPAGQGRWKVNTANKAVKQIYQDYINAIHFAVAA